MTTATRMRRLLERKGGTVTITAATRAYDHATDTETIGTPRTASGPAIETDGDADRFAALGLRLTNPVTLLIAADALPFPPEPGHRMDWAGQTYTVRDVEPRTLTGTPLAWRVTADR